MNLDDFPEARSFVREIADFPVPGIQFKDITPLLAEARIFQLSLERLMGAWSKERIDFVVSPESRGFILGSALALRLGAGFIPVRKPGRLPAKTIQVRYEMEYREDDSTNILQMHEDALRRGATVLVVDDILATGGTAWACRMLAETLGAKVAGAAFLVELSQLKGRDKLPGLPITSLLKY